MDFCQKTQNKQNFHTKYPILEIQIFKTFSFFFLITCPLFKQHMYANPQYDFLQLLVDLGYVLGVRSEYTLDWSPIQAHTFGQFSTASVSGIWKETRDLNPHGRTFEKCQSKAAFL